MRLSPPRFASFCFNNVLNAFRHTVKSDLQPFKPTGVFALFSDSSFQNSKIFWSHAIKVTNIAEQLDLGVKKKSLQNFRFFWISKKVLPTSNEDISWFRRDFLAKPSSFDAQWSELSDDLKSYEKYCGTESYSAFFLYHFGIVTLYISKMRIIKQLNLE